MGSGRALRCDSELVQCARCVCFQVTKGWSKVPARSNFQGHLKGPWARGARPGSLDCALEIAKALSPRPGHCAGFLMSAETSLSGACAEKKAVEGGQKISEGCPCVLILDLPFICCVALGKPLHLSKPEFSRL